MPLVRVLDTLFQLLDRKRKLVFSGLILVLLLTSVTEMLGMVVLFGFVRGLEADPDTAQRHGPLAKILELLAGGAIEQTSFVVYAGLSVIGFMLFKSLLGTGARFGLNRFLMKLNQRISELLFKGYLQAPYELFKKEGVQKPAKQIARIFDLYHDCFNATTQLIADAFVALMVAVLLVFVDPVLTLIGAVLFASVGTGLYKILQRALAVMGRETEEANKATSQLVRNGMNGVVELRLRGAVGYFRRSYSRALSKSAMLRRRQQAMARLPRSANELALAGLIVGSTLYVTLQGKSVAESLPTLGVFGFAGLRINGVLTRINVSAQTLRRRIEAFESSLAVVQKVAPDAMGSGKGHSISYMRDEEPLPDGVDGRLHRAITLSGVSFAYPGEEKSILHSVSLKIECGTLVGICGPSGGGKSTLLMILMGLLRPTQGSVCCDSWPVERHIRNWQQNIGYVGQSLFLTDQTIRENVAFGVPPAEIDDEKVWRAIRLASAEEFVKDLPLTIESPVRGGGNNISGGQRQRLVIARALYHDPDILVLDEATAALDNVTERDITHAISNLSGKKTIICVAHRLTSIQDCDQIHVLKGGRVVASGTYDDLINTSSDFQQMAHASHKPSRSSIN